MRPSRPPRGSSWRGPQLPRHLLRRFSCIEMSKEFLQDQGGISQEISRIIISFEGALLPINNEDLQYLPEGSYTVNSQKIYTNGAMLQPGQLVQDSLDGQVYTVFTELTHSPIHGLKRYVVTKKGVAAPRG